MTGDEHLSVGGAAFGGPGRYRLEARLATGGMGEVWRATDTVLGREVALKILKSEYADDPTFRSRFEAEARHAAALQHPNVASVFDFGELPTQDGSGTARPFLVMELVPGQPLSALLHGGEPMLPAHAAALIAQAADGIAAAHAMDVVHRDVKPANLMVTPDGQVKITDFGIARAADGVPLTQTGQIVGTPHYLSPEQAQGKPATEASDVYALGVVLYECLAGRRPFAADTPVTTALAHLRDPVPPLPGHIPVHLRAVVERALAKDPADRFSSAAELAAALRDHSAGPVTVPAETRVLTGVTAGATASARRIPPLAGWTAAAAGVLLLVILLPLLVDDGGDTDPAARGKLTDAQADRPPGDRSSDDLVRVRPSDYLGMEFKDAKDALEDRGLRVEERKRPATRPTQEKDTVGGVQPHGLVADGSTITLVVWEEYKPPEEDDGDEEHAGEGSGDTDEDQAGDPEKSDKDTGEKGPSEQGKKHGNPKGKKS